MRNQLFLVFMNYSIKRSYLLKCILLIVLLSMNICVGHNNITSSSQIEKDFDVKDYEKIYAEIIIEKFGKEQINTLESNKKFPKNYIDAAFTNYSENIKETFQMELYNEQAFRTTITKFKIHSSKIVYMDYNEIKERLVHKSK